LATVNIHCVYENNVGGVMEYKSAKTQHVFNP
jgi:hypothetical protein